MAGVHGGGAVACGTWAAAFRRPQQHLDAHKNPSGALPACEDTILSWVKGQGGSATISDAHSHAVAKVGENFTKSIEAENRGRFFHRNLGYVMACFAMTIAVIVGVIVFGGLQEQDIKIMAGIAFACFLRA